MERFQILINKKYSQLTGQTILGPVLSDDYYMYVISNGGGMVNSSNVRGYLNDQRNIQITTDFFAYLTGNTTAPQAVNILNSDEKLSQVFNDYYQEKILFNGNTNGSVTVSDSPANSNNANNGSRNTVSNGSTGNISISETSPNNSQSSTAVIQRNLTGGSQIETKRYFSPWTSSQTNGTGDSAIDANATDVGSLNNSTAEVGPGGNNGLGTVSIGNTNTSTVGGTSETSSNPNTDTSSSNTSSSNTSTDTDPNTNNNGLWTGPNNSTLPLVPSLLNASTNIWQDSTREESYYLPILLTRGSNQLASQRFDPAVQSVSKKLLNYYPQFSGITNVAPPLTNATRMNTLLNGFVDLNLELNEATYYQSFTLITIVDGGDDGGSAPSGNA